MDDTSAKGARRGRPRLIEPSAEQDLRTLARPVCHRAAHERYYAALAAQYVREQYPHSWLLTGRRMTLLAEIGRQLVVDQERTERIIRALERDGPRRIRQAALELRRLRLGAGKAGRDEEGLRRE